MLVKGPHYSWKKALLILTLSTVLVSGGGGAGLLFFRYAQTKNKTIPIRALVQNGPLPTPFLAEVLSLSLDCPTLFTQFDLKKGIELLRATHLVKEVRLKKIKPDILYIDYCIREPIAYLGNQTNTAIDQEGFVFPYLPFYLPKNLPLIMLHPYSWGERIEPKWMDLISDLLNRFSHQPKSNSSGCLGIKQIDLSLCSSPSLGKRQLILILNEGPCLRLTPKNYIQELKSYFMLDEQLTHISHICSGNSDTLAADLAPQIGEAVLKEESQLPEVRFSPRMCEKCGLTEKPAVIDFRNPNVAYLYFSYLKSGVLPASSVPQNRAAHSRLALEQWSLPPQPDFVEPPCQILQISNTRSIYL